MKRTIKYYIIFVLVILTSVLIYLTLEDKKNDDYVNTVSNELVNKKTVKYRKKLGEQIGYIEIPGVLDKIPIYYGESDYSLSKGVSLDESRKLPYQKGQTVLAGHRESFFKNLKIIKELNEKAIGKRIKVNVLNKIYYYRITEAIVVREDEGNSVYSGDLSYNELVLITCFPFEAWKDPTYRFIVKAKLEK